jgi:hypothetical protein
MPSGLHDFKMSVCEVTYQPENHVFDVKFYLFEDDFKDALYGDPQATKIDEESAKAYIVKHFELITNQQKQTLSYQSMRNKNDQVLVQFQSQKLPFKGISTIQVKNTILLDKFQKQINMLYLIFPEKPKQTLMLNATRTEGSFSL